MIGDAQWLLRLSRTSTLNERHIGIHTGDDGSLPCEAATEVAIAASEVQQMQPAYLANKMK